MTIKVDMFHSGKTESIIDAVLALKLDARSTKRNPPELAQKRIKRKRLNKMKREAFA